MKRLLLATTLALFTSFTAAPSFAETVEGVAKAWLAPNQEVEDVSVLAEFESQRLALAQGVAYLKTLPQFQNTTLSDQELLQLVSLISSEVTTFKPFLISEGGRSGIQIKTKIRLNEDKIPEKPEAYYTSSQGSWISVNKTVESSTNSLEEAYRAYLARLSQATDPAYVKMLKQQEGSALRKRYQTSKLLEDASRLSLKGEHARALKLLEQAIAQDPKNPLVYMTQYATFQRQNKYMEAARALTSAIAVAPKEPMFYYLRANAYFMEQSSSSSANALALQDVNKAIQLNPEFGDAYNLRGFIHKLYTKDCFKALEDFKRACELGASYACDERSC